MFKKGKIDGGQQLDLIKYAFARSMTAKPDRGNSASFMPETMQNIGVLK